jgi:hypothetical protein
MNKFSTSMISYGENCNSFMHFCQTTLIYFMFGLILIVERLELMYAFYIRLTLVSSSAVAFTLFSVVQRVQ